MKKEFMRIRKQPWRILLRLGVLAALVLNVYFFTIHESYRDEAQAWLIARDTDPVSIFNVLSYEGHPFLWYYLLMPFAKLGFPYVTIKIISTVLMAAVILMIAYRSPFSLPVKLSVILSGMCLYRYASFGRSYSLFAFLAVLICCLYKTRHEKPLRYFLAVAALIQTHILAVGFAFGLCVAYLCEEIARLRKSSSPAKVAVRRLDPLLIPLVSALILPLEFHDVRNAASNRLGDGPVLSRLLPTLSGLMENLLKEAAPWFLALFVLHIVLMIIWYRRGLAHLPVLLAGWAGGICVFVMSVSPADYRVFTLAYMVVAYLWFLKESLLQDKGEMQFSLRADPPGFLFRILTAALAIVLAVGTDLAVMTELKRDVNLPYSDAENTAAAVDSLPEDAVILECAEDTCNAVIPWLHRNTIINPFTDAPATYITRSSKLRHATGYKSFKAYCRERFPDKKEVYLLYCEKANKIQGVPTENLEIVYQTSERIMTREAFIIYRIKLK